MLLKKNIPVGFIARKVWRETIILPCIITSIYLLQSADWWPGFALPMSVITMLGTAISLLLAFRTNQSYDRWWEARCIWGGIVNDSRSFIRQIFSFTGAAADAQAKRLVHKIARRHIAWCYSLGQSLRGRDPLEGMKPMIDDDELRRLAIVDNKPNHMLLHQSLDLQQLVSLGAIDSFGMIQVDGTLSRLCDHMGKCERIKSTVFPSTYSLFIHSFIYLFVCSIPFGLHSDFGISEIPLAVGIGLAFFLIEKTAMHMQDPFENRPTDTAMTTIATNIHRNIVQMIDADTELPAKHPAEAFFAM